MSQEVMVLATLVLMIFISGGETYPGLILRGPETQTRPEGGSELFVCTAQGDVSWFINGQWLSYGYEDDLEDIGFTFSETGVSGTTYPTTNMTMTVPATNALNGTAIQCKTYGSDGIQVSSYVAWLWIAALPLPPNVSLELTSWNTMQLSWAAPFTTGGFPIVKYIVYTTNTTTEQRTRIDIYPTTGSETHTIQDTPSDCHTLHFEVLAENSVGTSTAGVVSGGFPVAVSEFQVNVSVVFLQTTFTPQATISFQLPDICVESGVSATYVMEVKMSSDLVLKMTAVYWHSVLIEETQPLEASESYTVNVTVFVPSYADLGSFTTIKEFDTFFPTTSPDPNEETTTGTPSANTSLPTATTTSIPTATTTSVPTATTTTSVLTDTTTIVPTATTTSVPTATTTTSVLTDTTTSVPTATTTSVPTDTTTTSVLTDTTTSVPTDTTTTSVPTDTTTSVLTDITTSVPTDTTTTSVPTDTTTTPAIASDQNKKPAENATTTSVPTATTSDHNKKPEDDKYMPIILCFVGVILLITLLIGACLLALRVRQSRRKTIVTRVSAMIGRPSPPMATNPIYDASPVYDVIPEPAQKQQSTKSLQSVGSRYSSTPSSHILKGDTQLHTGSMFGSPLSPNTPSPKEIDAMLCNTFASTLSPLSHQQSQTRSMDWDREDSGIYDTFSKKHGKGNKEKGAEEQEEKGVNDVEREDCYVLMQSNIV